MFFVFMQKYDFRTYSVHDMMISFINKESTDTQKVNEYMCTTYQVVIGFCKFVETSDSKNQLLKGE